MRFNSPGTVQQKALELSKNLQMRTKVRALNT